MPVRQSAKAVLALLAGAGPAWSGPEDVSGTLTWPAEWVVFLPLEREDHLLPQETLKRIPQSMEVPGFYGITKVIAGRRVRAEDGIVLDFAPLFGGVKVYNTAYAFLELHSDKAQTATLGMGADWFLQAWLNGALVVNTLVSGNGAWPPSISNHTVDVKLKKGMNVLAVRFISGSGSSVLTLGGPDELRAIAPADWARVEIEEPEYDPDLQVVGNHDFEAGSGVGAPSIPAGWRNGEGAYAFRPGEIALRTVDPISGEASLEINTMGGGDVSRKLYIPLDVDISIPYEISFTAQYMGGEYASISVRNQVDGSETSFIQAIGRVNTKPALRSAWAEVYRKTYYNDVPRPYLVIQTHGEVHLVLDDVSVMRREGGSQWAAGWDHQSIPWGDEWHLLSEEIETPHTRWAKPYAGGELKIVTVLPRWRHRWTLELAQRMSVSYQPVMFERENDFGHDHWIRGGGGEPEVFRALDDALEKLSAPVDCIVVRHLSPPDFPVSLTEKILARVRAGAGLVIFGDPIRPWHGASSDKYLEGAWSKALNDGHLTEEEIGYVSSGLVAGVEARFYRYGEGRIAFLKGMVDWDEEAPRVMRHGRYLRGEFEAEISYIMKAMVWASDRVPAAHISRIALPGVQHDALRSSIACNELSAAIQVEFRAPLPQAAELSWWFDDYSNDGRDLPRGATKLDAGSESARVELPRLAGGTHWLHVQLKSEQGSISDWSSVSLEVSGDIGIEEIKLGRDTQIGGRSTQGYYREGERLEGSVWLDQTPDDSHLLKLRLMDADGHLWHETTIDGLTGREIPFALDIETAPVLMHTLQAELLEVDGIADAHSRQLAIARRQDWYDDTFDFQLWQIPWSHAEPSYLGTLVSEQFRKRHGVTSAFWGHWRINAFNNIRTVAQAAVNFPGGTGVLGDKDHAPIRRPCLTDPSDARRGAAHRMEEVGQPDALPYAPLGYSMTHEFNLLGLGNRLGKADVCFSDHCIASFSTFAREEYGSLEALNTSWGTAFEAWSEVRPIVLADAVEKRQITRWIDHRRHMDRVFADFLQYKRDRLRRHDPEAQGLSDDFGWGAEGRMNYAGSLSGIDYWPLLSRVLAGSMLPLPHLRSFSPPEHRHLLYGRGDTFCVPWIHTADQELYSLRFGQQPWVCLFQGMNGFNYWAGIYGNVGASSNFRQPLLADLRTSEEGSWPIQPVAQIRTGIDRLIFESEFDDSGIAVLYSRSSEHAATAWQEIHGSDAASKLYPSRQFWLFTRILELLGYQYSAISEQQIADGMLQENGVRLLILPFAQALEIEAAAAVKEFVADGGMLLADIRPAVADRHGYPGAQGHLDEVFGVLHEAAWSDYGALETELTFSGGGDGLKMDVVDVPVIAGPPVALTTARSLGETDERAVMLISRYGAGRAALLNFAPLAADAGAVGMMKRLMGWYGLTPLFGVERLQVHRPERYRSAELESPDAELERPTLSHFSDGNIHTLALWHSFILQLDSGKRRGAGTEVLRITPPVAGHVYDLKSNQYLGRHDSFEVEKPLEGLGAYAVVPYRIGKPHLETSEGVTEAGNIRLINRVRTAPAAAAKERHVVRLRLYAPDGSELEDFAENIVAADGAGAHEFILPLNAPRGRWKVEAREAISGLAHSVSLRLD